MTSIRSLLAKRLLLGFVLLLSGASVTIYFISKDILEDDFDSRLFAKAQAVLASISQQGDKIDIDWDNLPKELHSHAKGNPSDLIEVIDSAGHSLARDSILKTSAIPLPDHNGYSNINLPALGNSRMLTLFFLPHVEEDDLARTPSNLRHRCALIVASKRKELDQTLERLATVLGGMTALTSLFSLGMVSLTLSNGLRPLNKLSLEVSRIDASSLEKRITLPSLPAELLPIAEKLNNLLGRLEISFAREKRFSADVSHELRTPIAELRTVAEVMLRFPEGSAETRQAFQDIFDASLRMESLVTVLLEIVRNDQNSQTLQFSRLDLIRFTHETWRGFTQKAADKNLGVSLPLSEKALMIETEPRLLRIILSNLFANATEYTPEKGRIAVTFAHDDNSVCLVISNTADGITSSDLPHLFERFWRKDKARSNSEHFGLGLSLAEILSKRLDMQLTACLPGDSTISFRLKIPVRPSGDEK
ncbi:MAG TPA: ATP-binding protein [Candidatus Methylacidiphilales bacterium]|nr:ATP-binding protein [Candidatus Methylacidiphilales bacterium]